MDANWFNAIWALGLPLIGGLGLLYVAMHPDRFSRKKNTSGTPQR